MTYTYRPHRSAPHAGLLTYSRPSKLWYVLAILAIGFALTASYIASQDDTARPVRAIQQGY